MDAEEYLRNAKAHVWKETFAVIKARKPCANAFANIIDKKEITVIIEQSRLSETDAIKTENGWRIITFDAVLPFELVGFLAAVSTVLADAGIPLFAVSSYSTDHVLVKQKHLQKAIGALEKLGCAVKQE